MNDESRIRSGELSVVDAARYALLWLIALERTLTLADCSWVEQRLPGARAVPTHLLAEFAAEKQLERGAVILQRLRGISRDERAEILKAAVELIAHDGRVSIAERHGLVFLADLLGCALEGLKKIFEARFGFSLMPFPDLSSPAYWESVERAREERAREESRQRSTGGGGQRASFETAGDARRIEALAILGLVGSPSGAEIKQAYQRLARLHHPDRYGEQGEEAVATATRTFQRIQTARDYLLKGAR